MAASRKMAHYINRESIDLIYSFFHTLKCETQWDKLSC